MRWLTIALAINAGFMVVEVAVGVIASSLAVLSDAAHMLTDAGAIGLALFAARLARRRPKGAMTYGLGRAEILSAQANGLTLIILAGFIVYEAIRRLVHPPQVDASLMLAIGLAGVVVNLAAAVALARANRESLNVEGAFQHNLIDAYASVATALAAGVILLTGFDRADPIASLLIAAPMLRSGYKLVRRPDGSSSKPPPRASTPTRSATRWPRSPASLRSTTCTSGRSPAASPPSRRTCSSRSAPTATPNAAISTGCSTNASASSTPPCRSTTRPASCASKHPGAEKTGLSACEIGEVRCLQRSVFASTDRLG